MQYHITHEIPGRLRIHLCMPRRPLIDAAHIGTPFKQHKGVHQVSFSTRTGNLLITYDGSAPVRDAILRMAAAIEFPKTGRLHLKDHATELDSKRASLVRSGVSLLLRPVIAPALRPFITILGALPILKKGAASLFQGKINSNVLDASAIGVSMASRDFLTASIISFLLKLGEFLEEWTRRRFRKQMAEMFRTGEEWAWVIRDGRQVRVELEQVSVGDTVVVRMGGFIPVDGVILEGEAMVNQASLTGEGLAVMKRKGKLVYAGTAVEEGSIQVRVLKVGSQTRAARVVQVIEAAEGLKAETQSYGEKLADRVVPYSFLLSGLTYLLTGNGNRAAAVLLVDYSCAIKLSTPLALLSGMAKAARAGILIKGGRSLEKLSRADAFILDKTGTLTEAAPQVVEVTPFGGYESHDMLKQAACVEEHFTHPMASAVVRYAAEKEIVHEEEHDEVEYVLAHGIVSRVHGERIMVGSRHFIQDDEAVDVSQADSVMEACAANGQSALYVAIGRKLAGIIAIHDPLRTDARGFVEALRAQGIEKIVLLTGDNAPTAANVARALGITTVHAEAFPEKKVSVVQSLQKEGYVVAMVGDGINDSPALSHADVGISMQHGAEIAQEACDVLLMEGNLADMLVARRIAEETLTLVKQNYRTILAVNSIAILLAITGTMPPIYSAALHNLSTIAVSLKAMGPLRRGTIRGL